MTLNTRMRNYLDKANLIDSYRTDAKFHYMVKMQDRLMDAIETKLKQRGVSQSVINSVYDEILEEEVEKANVVNYLLRKYM